MVFPRVWGLLERHLEVLFSQGEAEPLLSTSPFFYDDIYDIIFLSSYQVFSRYFLFVLGRQMRP